MLASLCVEKLNSSVPFEYKLFLKSSLSRSSIGTKSRIILWWNIQYPLMREWPLTYSLPFFTLQRTFKFTVFTFFYFFITFDKFLYCLNLLLTQSSVVDPHLSNSPFEVPPITTLHFPFWCYLEWLVQGPLQCLMSEPQLHWPTVWLCQNNGRKMRRQTSIHPRDWCVSIWW